MRKKICILLCVILLLGSITACTSQQEESNQVDEGNEYAIYYGEEYYPISYNFVMECILDGETEEDIPEEFPYPAGKRHFGDGIEIKTFIVDDERGKGEVIYHISATKDTKTIREVGIGDALKALQEAYGIDLIYENDWIYNPEDSGPMFNQVYIFAPEDGTTNYIAFFLMDEKIVMIELGEGFDYRPGHRGEIFSALGMDGVYKRTGEATALGMDISYCYTNKNGEEEILLNTFAKYTREVDIDEDGIVEVVEDCGVSAANCAVYDLVDGQIARIDINEAAGSLWSSFMGDMANAKPEYRTCFETGFKDEDGTEGIEVYRVIDNKLIYVCPFSNDVLMK
ncbi:MAG: hypothetical protein PHG06_17630 [Parabacteroides sp.]|nr:hypothetical protein [Parabacteroides sp.]